MLHRKRPLPLKTFVLVCAALGLSSAAWTSEYRLYYSYEDRAWSATKIDGTPLKNLPKLMRGDNVQLFVLHNTLATSVTVEADQRSFASTPPDILTKLLPGVGKANMSGGEATVMLSNLATIYPVVYQQIRSVVVTGDAAAVKKLTIETLKEIGSRVVPEFTLTVPNLDTKDTSDTKKVDGLGEFKIAGLTTLSAKVRIGAALARRDSNQGEGTDKKFASALALADLIEEVEKGKIFVSGPFGIEPDQDVLDVKINFAKVTSPTFSGAPATAAEPGEVGGPGGDTEVLSHGPFVDTPIALLAIAQSQDDGQKTQENSNQAPKQIPSSDQVAPKSFMVGSRGIAHVRPTYSAGLAYSRLLDISFRKVTTGEGDGAVTTLEKGAKDSWKIVPAAFVHWNLYNSADTHWGPALGVLYSDDDKLVSYFAGVSLQVGRLNRLGINAGWQFGQVDVLDGVEFGDTIADDQTLTRKVWRSKFVAALSYSF